VLAKTLTPKIHTLNIGQSTALGALEAQATDPPFTADRFNAGTPYMWSDIVALPTFQPAYGQYSDIVMHFLARVERGELTPEMAADAAILRLQNEMADEILVE
jgi:hypothetical protein